jgi:hypothetical protein
LRGYLGGDYPLTHPALCGIPTDNRVIWVACCNRLVGNKRYPASVTLWNQQNLRVRSLSRVTQGASHRLCKILRDRGLFPVGLNSLCLNSPCNLLVKPGILAACITPHQYLSGAAFSPPACIHRTLRSNDSPPAHTGGGATDLRRSLILSISAPRGAH